MGRAPHTTQQPAAPAQDVHMSAHALPSVKQISAFYSFVKSINCNSNKVGSNT